MALTRSQPTVALSRHDVALHFLQPSAQQLLQREIEDTLMILSAVPETQDRVWLDLSVGKDGSRRIPVQSNQLALFQRLEELVALLDPEQKDRLIGNLHPAMSVQEREALKIVLERGLGGVVSRGLELKRARSMAALQIDEKGDGWVQRKLFTIPPPWMEVQELVVSELTAKEMAIREHQLELAKAAQDGELVLASDQARRTSAETKRRRQEIADMFSEAAKKLQVMEGAASGFANPVQSPTFKEGLQLVKTAMSALRAYTDVTPREVIVGKSPGTARLDEDVISHRLSGQLPRLDAGNAPPQRLPVTEYSARASNALAPDPIKGGPPPSPLPPSPPPKDPTSSDRPRLSRKFKKPPPVLSTEELRRQQSQPTPELSIRSRSSTASKPVMQFDRQDQADRLPTGLVPSPTESSIARPRSDPSKSTCPWPDSFFVAPRPAPARPTRRSVSVPVPPPPPVKTAQQRDNDILAAVRQDFLTHSRAPDGAVTAHRAVLNQATPGRPCPSPSFPKPMPTTRRHGSISAARAGIAARLQHEQVTVVRRMLPYARSSLEGRWTGVSSRRGEWGDGDGEGRWEVVGSASVEGGEGGLVEEEFREEGVAVRT